MKTSHATAIVLLVATLGSGYALAADTATHSVTRAQVLAELAEAKSTGNILDGKTGKMLNEVYPSRYPAKPVVSSVTREQVLAELAEAQRTGNILDGKTGKMLNELHPELYSSKS